MNGNDIQNAPNNRLQRTAQRAAAEPGRSAAEVPSVEVRVVIGNANSHHHTGVL